MSLVASRGQQPLIVPSPAGRGKGPQLSARLLTPHKKPQCSGSSISAFSAPSDKSFICVPINIHKSFTVRIKAAKVTCFEDRRMSSRE